MNKSTIPFYIGTILGLWPGERNDMGMDLGAQFIITTIIIMIPPPFIITATIMMDAHNLFAQVHPALPLMILSVPPLFLPPPAATQVLIHPSPHGNHNNNILAKIISTNLVFVSSLAFLLTHNPPSPPLSSPIRIVQVPMMTTSILAISLPIPRPKLLM